MNTFEKLKEYPAHDDDIICIAISPDDKMILTSGLDGKVIINELQSGYTLAKVEFHQDIVMAAEFSKCGKYLVTGSRDNIARLYSIEYDFDGLNLIKELNYLTNFVGHNSWVTSVSISDDNLQVLTGGKDEKAILFNIESGAIVAEYVGNAACLTAVAFTPDQTQVVTIAINGGLRVYDKLTGVLN